MWVELQRQNTLRQNTSAKTAQSYNDTEIIHCTNDFFNL